LKKTNNSIKIIPSTGGTDDKKSAFSGDNNMFCSMFSMDGS
jgi:hypothetical protein